MTQPQGTQRQWRVVFKQHSQSALTHTAMTGSLQRRVSPLLTGSVSPLGPSPSHPTPHNI